MDYGRLKELAEAFVGRGCDGYPSELEAAIRETATTGTVRMQWSLFCPVLHHRLDQEIRSTFSESELAEEDREMKLQLLKQLDNFENPPFTVQRLCELILQPKKHYKKLDCYMRAVEKNLLVVGTQEPDLDWMKSQGEEKATGNVIKENGTTDVSDEPHSPSGAPPPVDKDSPPTAPTSTWSNLREEGGGTKEEEEEGRGVEGGRTHSPLPSRKRRRDSLNQGDDDKSSITVRQEADSTVNFDPPPPLFQMVDESPNKRSRECGPEVGRGTEGEEKMEESETESVLSSSSELMETGGRGEGEGGERKELTYKTSETALDRSSPDETAPGNQEVKQVLQSENSEAMITN